MRKKLGICLLVLSLLLAISPIPVEIQADSSNRTQAINTAQNHFSKQFSLKRTSISSPWFYDVNNDGTDEIILSAPSKREYGPLVSYLGIYSSAGTKLMTQNIESDYIYEIRPIKNETYNNLLAFIDSQGNAGSSVSVKAFKNNTLNEVFGTFPLGVDVDRVVIKDEDQDGNDEIHGYRMYSAAETRNLAHVTAVYDKVVHKWDSKFKKYGTAIYGQDGIQDSQRVPVGPIDAQQALKLLQQARYKQLTMAPQGSPESLRKSLQYVFTYNFINEIENQGLINFGNGKVGPNYLHGDNDLLLLPAFDTNKKATLRQVASGQAAILTQAVKKTIGKKSYTFTYEATFYRTKYGWKVNSFRNMSN